MCITIPLGITAMCIGMVVSSLISLFINTYYTGKLINIGCLKQIRDLLPILFNSLLMGSMVYLFIQLFNNDFVKLIVGVFIGAISYIGGASFFSKQELKECWSLFKR